jgi:hypothetical protein
LSALKAEAFKLFPTFKSFVTSMDYVIRLSLSIVPDTPTFPLNITFSKVLIMQFYSLLAVAGESNAPDAVTILSLIFRSFTIDFTAVATSAVAGSVARYC